MYIYILERERDFICYIIDVTVITFIVKSVYKLDSKINISFNIFPTLIILGFYILIDKTKLVSSIGFVLIDIWVLKSKKKKKGS